MSFGNFVPEIWSAALLMKLRDVQTYAQAGIINRNYEGDVARAGDTVHITTPGRVEVRDYTKNAGNGATAAITYDLLNDTAQTLTVSQAKYFGIEIDDIDKRQALPGFLESEVSEAAYSMAQATDTYVSGVMAAGVAADNKLDDVTTKPDASGAYGILVDLRTKLVRGNTPANGRWVVVPPEFYALLLQDDRFIRAADAGTTEGLRNGVVGRAAGFDVIESNVVPFTADLDGAGTGTVGGYTVLAGHANATTFVDQIVQTEALRLHTGFSDAVRGLHLFDAAVLTERATNLASVRVNLV